MVEAVIQSYSNTSEFQFIFHLVSSVDQCSAHGASSSFSLCFRSDWRGNKCYLVASGRRPWDMKARVQRQNNKGELEKMGTRSILVAGLCTSCFLISSLSLRHKRHQRTIKYQRIKAQQAWHLSDYIPVNAAYGDPRLLPFQLVVLPVSDKMVAQIPC